MTNNTSTKALTPKQQAEADFQKALAEFYANGGQTTLVPARCKTK